MKSMIMRLLQKWNSWNVSGINKLSSSLSGTEVTYFFLKEDRRLDEIRNFNLHKLSYYSIECGYFEYEVRFEEAVIGIRVAAGKETLLFEFTPLKHCNDILVGGKIKGSFGKKARVKKTWDVFEISSNNRRTSTLFFTDGDTAVDRGMLLVPLRGKRYLVFTDIRSKVNLASADTARNFIDRAKDKYLHKTRRADEEKAESVRLVAASVNLNTIYIPGLKEIVCTSSRAWSVGPIWGGYIFFIWDSLVMSLMASVESKNLAYAYVIAILNQANKNGMLPGGIGKFLVTRDRSSPPVESFCILKLYQKFKEKEFLKRCYPALKRSLQFYINNCDGNSDGLYEWYSLPYKMTSRQKAYMEKVNRLLLLGEGTGTLQGAKYSSGLDNSPTFDDAEFDEKSHTIKIADIGLNSLLVEEAESLQVMAEILGYKSDRKFFLDFHTNLKKLIQENLWDDSAGIYKSRKWNGEFISALGPMNFYPLLTGIPDRKQAERMVKEHLLNPEEFWGEYVIPTIARNHPSFGDQDYWRGRIWGPTNYLIYAGLRRYGFNKEADELALKSARLFLREYRKDSHIHENYNAITGNGDDVNAIEGKIKSDAYYPFGARLLFLYLEREC